MARQTPFLSSAIRTGAAHGALAGGIYAIVECWLFSVVPGFVRPSYAYSPIHGGFTALTFLAYPLAGVVLGGICGTFARAAIRGAWPEGFGALLGSAAVLLGFNLNLVPLLLQGVDSPFSFRQSPVHLLLPVAISVGLTAAIAASAASAPRLRSLRFLTNPWTTSLLLVGLPWTTVALLARAGSGTKMAAAVVFPVAVALGSLLIERTAARRTRTSRLALALYFSLAVVVTFGLAASRKQSVRETGPPPPAPAGTNAAPNVVLIVMDTARADHLALYGYERDTSPELQELAAEAVVYTRAMATGDMTLTTHGSLFTGLYGRQHGAHRSEAVPTGRPLSEKFDTMAEILAAEGYWTAAVVANTAYLSHAFGFGQGFQYYDVRGPVLFLGNPPVYSPRRSLRAVCASLASRATVDRRYRDAAQINRETFPLLDRIRDRRAPFFLFLNYMDAHVPVIPPPPFDTRYPGKNESFTTDRYYEILRAMIRGDGEPTEAERRHMVSQYDGGIAYVDSEIGILLDALRERGLYENTLIIVTSDHGEAFGERALLNHGVSVYQNQVSIPLVVRYPRGDETGVRDGLVSSVDVLPTVLDAAGIDSPEGLPGQSLAREDPPRARAVASESFPFLFDLNPDFLRVERAVFSGTHKLIASTTGKRELYDLSTDSDEEVNLYDERDSVTIDLERRLTGWLDVIQAETDSAASVQLDAATRDRLKALGYIH